MTHPWKDDPAKTCLRCERVLPINAFLVDDPECRACSEKYSRRFREMNCSRARKAWGENTFNLLNLNPRDY